MRPELPLFITAAAVLAATPGAGTLYVLGRTLRGGWREGVASVIGTGAGGSVHVLVAALGGAALLGRDVSRLRLVSLVGAAYLAYLGLRGLHGRAEPVAVQPGARRRAFRDGLVIALLNPSTAVFLLAFLPQFIDPARPALPQLLALGAVTIALNASAHLVWVAVGARLGGAAVERPAAQVLTRRAGSLLLLALAVYSAVRALR